MVGKATLWSGRLYVTAIYDSSNFDAFIGNSKNNELKVFLDEAFMQFSSTTFFIPTLTFGRLISHICQDVERIKIEKLVEELKEIKQKFIEKN